MNVFVIGGSGFIGEAVARAFKAGGHSIVVLCQSTASSNRMGAEGFKVRLGNIAKPDHWLGYLTSADVVVYAAQPKPGKRLSHSWVARCQKARDAAFNAILPALEQSGRCKAFLYTSGIVALGNHGDAKVTETTTRTPTALGDFHAESEARLLAAAARGLPAVILRPGFAYGPSGSFAEFFIKEARKGFYPYPGRGSNFVPWVHVDDLATAYVNAALAPPIGEIIHVVDDEPVRLKTFASALIQAAGGGRTVGMPKWLVTAIAGGPLVEMLTASYRADNAKAKRLLKWQPSRPSAIAALPEVFRAYDHRIGQNGGKA